MRTLTHKMNIIKAFLPPTLGTLFSFQKRVGATYPSLSLKKNPMVGGV